MKRAAAVALASLAILAGCVAPATKIDPAVALDSGALASTAGVIHDAKGQVLALGDAVQALGGQYHIGLAATEPTIGADAKGAVYMTAMSSNPTLAAAPRLPAGNMRTGPTIVRTLDGGQTFEEVGPKLPTGDNQRLRTWDPYVYVDVDTGRVFMDDIYPLGCGALAWSDDQGATWTTNPLSCGNPNVNDHQSMVTAKPRGVTTVGYDKVVYRCVNNVAAAECAISLTGGLTFTPQIPVYAANNEPGCGALFGHLRADVEGRVFIPNAGCDAGPTVWMTEDDGLSWTPITIPTDKSPSDHEMGFAIDEAGNWYATWESEGFVWLASSPDQGATWSEARNVVAPGVTATMFNTLAAAGPGKIAFAYLGSTIEGGYEGKGQGNPGLEGDLLGQPKLPEWDDATWNAYIGIMTDATSPDATIQTVTANDPADPLARGLCGGTRCNGMNDFIEMTIDAQGRPWAAFVDVCIAECVTDPSVHADGNLGLVATLRSGPSLLAAGGLLPELALQPMGHEHAE